MPTSRTAIPTACLERRLREGQNDQVRRTSAAAGHPTLRIIRVAVGPCDPTGLARVGAARRTRGG